MISVPAIVYQAVEGMIEALRGNSDQAGGITQKKEDDMYGDGEYSDRLDRFTDAEKYDIACNLLTPDLAGMFVTPKNIDEAIKRVSYTISEAINGFLNYKRN